MRAPWTHAPSWGTLLWDWDGTIADTVPQIVAAHHKATEDVLSRRIDEDAIRRRIGEPARRRIGALVDVSHAHDVFVRYSAFLSSIGPRDVPLFAGVLQVIANAEANGITNIIVTSRPRAQVVPVLEHYGLQDLFRGVVGLEDTTKHKPSPEPLLRGAVMVGAEPSACAYVGDAVADLEAASAAGMAAIAVTWGAGRQEDLVAARPRLMTTSAAELHAAVIGGCITWEDNRSA